MLPEGRRVATEISLGESLRWAAAASMGASTTSPSEKCLEQMDYSPAQIREWIRGFFLLGILMSQSLVGVRLHTSTSADLELCAHAFDIYHGLSLGYTYRHIRALKDGIVLDHDDHGRGGAAGGDGFPDDSPQSMVSGIVERCHR